MYRHQAGGVVIGCIALGARVGKGQGSTQLFGRNRTTAGLPGLRLQAVVPVIAQTVSITEGLSPDLLVAGAGTGLVIVARADEAKSKSTVFGGGIAGRTARQPPSTRR